MKIRTASAATLLAVLIMVSLASASQIGGAPVRFDTAEALKQTVKRVEPSLPPDIVAANPGAVLAADVVIRADGTVESVTLVTGPGALERPFVEALRQWVFRPFLRNGRPVRAVAMIDLALANPREESLRKASNDYLAAELACERALATDARSAEPVCLHAVSLSETLDASRRLERSHALGDHGISLAAAGRNADALARFEQAIAAHQDVLRAERSDSAADADMAGLLTAAAGMEARLNRLSAAAARYTTAISILERAIETLPEFRERYLPRLRNALEQAAVVKRALGESGEAAALEKRASDVSTSPPAAMPTRQLLGLLVLGTTAAALTEDDVRQVTALVPAGKKTWFLVAGESSGDGGRMLVATLYLNPDGVRLGHRWGRAVMMQAAWPERAASDTKRTWKRWIEWPYVHVPRAGREPDDVRGNDDRNRPVLVPKTPSEALTIDDAAAIVTLVQRTADGSRNLRTGAVYEAVQPWTIEDVTAWSGGDVHVHLRANVTVHGPGQRVTVRKMAEWTIVEIQPW
ncbi:MAG TPA: energy transducer TonB [Vicinamibacterales bacterium]|jgi:tetratricopeptide (TPR) repeat protein